jgi:precorrin-2 dehydrogenase/sirohydrochlorin ferrochelatase
LGFLTINLDMTGREVVLVGAGRVGRRKLADLVKAGARVRVVEPEPDDEVLALAKDGQIRLEPAFSESFLDLRPLIFVAIDDPEEGSRLAALARGRGLLINVADKPLDCDFHMPAVADFSPLRLAVTTDGASPALSALIAKELRERYRGHGLLAALLGELRPEIMASELPPPARREILTLLAGDSALLAMLAEGKASQARDRAGQLIRTFEDQARSGPLGVDG